MPNRDKELRLDDLLHDLRPLAGAIRVALLDALDDIEAAARRADGPVTLGAAELEQLDDTVEAELQRVPHGVLHARGGGDVGQGRHASA